MHSILFYFTLFYSILFYFFSVLDWHLQQFQLCLFLDYITKSSSSVKRRCPFNHLRRNDRNTTENHEIVLEIVTQLLFRYFQGWYLYQQQGRWFIQYRQLMPHRIFSRSAIHFYIGSKLHYAGIIHRITSKFYRRIRDIRCK